MKNLIVFLLFSKTLNAQSFFNHIQLLSYQSRSEQDRRLFEMSSSNQQILLSLQTNKKDKECGFAIQKRIYHKKTFEGYLGFGFSHFESKFIKPFNHWYPYNSGLLISLFTKRYTIISGDIVSDNKFEVFKKKNVGLSISVPVNFKFDFKEKVLVRTQDELIYKWNKFRFRGVEFLAGAECRVWRFRIMGGYRIINMKTIDHIMFDEQFFQNPDPPFLKKKFDYFNPRKFLLRVGFDISHR